MTDAPTTWGEALRRLSRVFGGSDGESLAIAAEWLREALHAAHSVEDASTLLRRHRQVALTRLANVVVALESQGELAFSTEVRAIVAAAFERHFAGVRIDGPPWRIDALDVGRPTWEEWKRTADFDSD